MILQTAPFHEKNHVVVENNSSSEPGGWRASSAGLIRERMVLII